MISRVWDFNKLLILISYIFINISFFSIAQENNCYFITFKDKNGTPHQISHPEEFLSKRAIARRTKQSIAIDSADLGVSTIYIDSIKKIGITILHTSKWLNGAIITPANEDQIDTLKNIHFITSVSLNKGEEKNLKNHKLEDHNSLIESPQFNEPTYGYAYNQINTVNGIALHQAGYYGHDVHIAVIDAGFYRANQLSSFNHLYKNNQILGTKDFVDSHSNFYAQHYHGMHVLSIIGGEIENEFLGTAPKASFWLLRTEDSSSEYPIEADYWICAAEFADSAGVDIINTSLGYTFFDNPTLNYSPDQLDGSTRISTAANMAVNKGMIVVVSAGNEGNSSWRYISTPSDADNVLCIGAMKSDSIITNFSSLGYPPIHSASIKPDIVSMGYYDAYQSSTGEIRTGSGTSYSAPVITGLMACLWEALPDFTAHQLIDLIKQSADQYKTPNLTFGYGIPDFKYALNLGNELLNNLHNNVNIWPNPYTDILNINFEEAQNISVMLFNTKGEKIKTNYFSGANITIDNWNDIPKGIYILKLTSNKISITLKISKK